MPRVSINHILSVKIAKIRGDTLDVDVESGNLQ